MRKKVYASYFDQYSRYDYMDMIDDLLRQTGKYEEIEEILYRHNASEDDSDPDEGYYASMNETDLRLAYEEILNDIEINADSNPKAYYASLSVKRNLTAYEQGWMDGYEACKRR